MSVHTPENRLLAVLPPNDFARLTARMTAVTFGHKDDVYRSGEPIDHVYFPRTGLISSVIGMLDGSTAEVAAIGFEGMLGVTAVLGADKCDEHVFCQVEPSLCRKIARRRLSTR